MSDTEITYGIELSLDAPAETRQIVADLLEPRVAGDGPLREHVAAAAMLIASEMIADALDHGSDHATVCISLTDDLVRLEIFDGPRRSAISITDTHDELSNYRQQLLAGLSDRWSTHWLGDGHFARCEIRAP